MIALAFFIMDSGDDKVYLAMTLVALTVNLVYCLAAYNGKYNADLNGILFWILGAVEFCFYLAPTSLILFHQASHSEVNVLVFIAFFILNAVLTAWGSFFLFHAILGILSIDLFTVKDPNATKGEGYTFIKFNLSKKMTEQMNELNGPKPKSGVNNTNEIDLIFNELEEIDLNSIIGMRSSSTDIFHNFNRAYSRLIALIKENDISILKLNKILYVILPAISDLHDSYVSDSISDKDLSEVADLIRNYTDDLVDELDSLSSSLVSNKIAIYKELRKKN